MFEFLRKRKSLPADEPASPAAFDPEVLKLLFQHFHIGRKVRYYPEFQREIDFHTIVIAYRVNNQFIYSREAVLTDARGMPTGFRLGTKEVLPVDELRSLQILLPDTSDMEKTLDYFTRAEIGRAGQFRQGNAITLVAETEDRGIPTVDTRVERRQVMKGGPYDDSSTVLVVPDLETLTLADKRRKQRVETAIPAYLYPEGQSAPVPCVMADFADTSLRLNVRDPGQVMPPLDPETSVAVVEFSLSALGDEYRIRGRVFRREDDFCVVQVEQLLRDGRFDKVRVMDIIEIKTGLLNPGD